MHTQNISNGGSGSCSKHVAVSTVSVVVVHTYEHSTTTTGSSPLALQKCTGRSKNGKDASNSTDGPTNSDSSISTAGICSTTDK
eukprot:8253-Heterococcus_DN1.PRE.2